MSQTKTIVCPGANLTTVGCDMVRLKLIRGFRRTLRMLDDDNKGKSVEDEAKF